MLKLNQLYYLNYNYQHYLNTSYVKVKRPLLTFSLNQFQYLNTSYVKVKLCAGKNMEEECLI